jgi:16S rRNA (cytidine1402-2'-O)-methyltransferase
MTPRGVQALSEADIIFAEDTRTARALLNYLKLSKPIESYHKDNEGRASAKAIKHLSEGKRIALVSEAGMPGISDPGMLFIKEAIRANIPFEVIPGACAALNALLASGLSGRGSFLFYGFLPRKGAEAVLLKLKKIPFPIVIYESCHRIAQTAELLLKYFPPPLAVCRELTKIYEEVVWLNSPHETEKITPKGEFTLVVNNESAEREEKTDGEQVSVAALTEVLKDRGVGRAEIMDILKKLGVKRNKAYRGYLKGL